MLNQEISKIKANRKVKVVEHAFVSKMRGKDVFFVKAEGVNPTAYILPDGFLNKLQAKLVRDTQPKELFPLEGG